MTDKQLDEKFVKTFENVHADLAVKARIRKELTGDKMNTRNITVNSETAQHIKENKAAVKPTGQIIAAAAALVIAVGGGYYMRQRAANVNIDDNSSAIAAADISSAESDLSFENSYTAALCKKFDSRHFNAQFIAADPNSINNDGSIRIAENRIVSVDGDNIYKKTVYTGDGLFDKNKEYTAEQYLNGDESYLILNGELKMHEHCESNLEQKNDPDNQSLCAYILDSDGRSPMEWTFMEVKEYPDLNEIEEHFTYTMSYTSSVNQTFADLGGEKKLQTKEFELIFYYEADSGNLLRYTKQEVENPEDSITYQFEFSDDPGNVIIPEYLTEGTGSDVSFEDSCTAGFLKKLDSRNFSVQLEKYVVIEEEKQLIANMTVETNGDVSHMCISDTVGSESGGLGKLENYYTKDSIYTSRNDGEWEITSNSTNDFDKDYDADNSKLHCLFFNIDVSPKDMEFTGSEIYSDKILEHFKKEYSDDEYVFVYDKNSGDLLNYQIITVGSGTTLVEIKSFTEDASGLKAPESDEGNTENKVSVPNVVGLNREEAVDRLKASGLTPVVEEYYEHIGDNDKVIDMSIAPDILLDAGSEVTITVAVNDAEDLDISVDLPEGLHGTYYITAYKDGKELSTTILDADTFTESCEKISIAGTGTEIFDIVITNKNTGKSVNYCTYIVDFDKKTATLKDGGFNKDGLLLITPAE